MAHDVFICYSSKDKTTADAVCAVLESEGIRCWIAPRDILAGMSYGEAIVDAIHSAKALVLVFSGHANASPQIEREVERAINKRIPVVPLRIEDVAPDKALEYFLSTPHWLDAFTPPLERHLRNLAGQIHRLIGTTPKPAEGAAAAPSPFKTMPAPEPPRETPPQNFSSVPPSASAASATAAAANPGAAGGGATAASAASMPRSATAKPATSPLDTVKNLDTGAKVGLGVVVLVLVIGVGWALTGGGGPDPASTQTPQVTITPNGGVTVNDGKDRVQIGPGGVRTNDGTTPAPGAPAMPGHSPSESTAVTIPGDAIDTVSASDLSQLLNESGHQAMLQTDAQGQGFVTGSVDGLKYSVTLYRCRQGASPRRCLDLQFHAEFNNDANVTNVQMNAYNRDNRFGQAYFMQNGGIGLDMSATLQGGVSRQHIKEVIDWWKVTLTAFPKKISGD